MKGPLSKGAIVALSLLVVAGCGDEEDEEGPSVVGSWSSAESVVGVHNALSADDGGSGHVTLYILFTENGQTAAGRFEFAAEWDKKRRSGNVDFVMTCERTPFGECEPADNFEMECDINDDGSAMSCDGTNNWREYLFDWVR